MPTPSEQKQTILDYGGPGDDYLTRMKFFHDALQELTGRVDVALIEAQCLYYTQEAPAKLIDYAVRMQESREPEERAGAAIVINWLRLHAIDLTVDYWRKLLDDPDLRVYIYALRRLKAQLVHGDYTGEARDELENLYEHPPTESRMEDPTV